METQIMMKLSIYLCEMKYTKRKYVPVTRKAREFVLTGRAAWIL